MRRYVPAFALFALFVVALSTPKWAAGQQQTEEEKLHGTWNYTSFEFMGKSLAVPEGKAFTFSKGGKVVLKSKGKPEQVGSFKIDVSKNPKQIDLINPEEKNKDKMVTQGIYRIEGDTLTMAFFLNTPGERPTAFDSTKAGIMTLKRQKP
jgi:uncharacterized protein (TIGR03067 family)